MSVSILILFALQALFINTEDNSEFKLRDFLFPAEAKTICFNSNVGEALREIVPTNSSFVVKSYSDNFEFTQRFLVRNDSVFVDSLYKKIDFLLVFSKESSVIYDKPFLRFPPQFKIGDSWSSEVTEISSRYKRPLNISTQVLGKEKINTNFGELDALLFEMIVKTKSGRVISRMKEWRAKNYGLVKMEAAVKSRGLIGAVQSLLGLDKFSFVLTSLN